MKQVFVDDRGDWVDEDGKLFKQQPLRLREALVGWFVTVALIVVIPLSIGFYADRRITNDRLSDNASFTRRLNQAVFQLCVEGEQRDTVIVQQLHAAIVRAKATLPAGGLRDSQIDTLEQGILALEPPNETDCVLPGGKP